jgi:hypothetical protein
VERVMKEGGRAPALEAATMDCQDLPLECRVRARLRLGLSSPGEGGLRRSSSSARVFTNLSRISSGRF